DGRDGSEEIRNHIMSPSVINGNHLISVTARGGETPNYTFPVRWAKSPLLEASGGKSPKRG
ncbi:hypothetical protein, partial [Armatimonas sp.]|uniref:hypothetical protein n=1 Tax=Armatimonas sp. TaxID=1872638 RepID=UPI00286C74D5